jgi:hypothetical protein
MLSKAGAMSTDSANTQQLDLWIATSQILSLVTRDRLHRIELQSNRTQIAQSRGLLLVANTRDDKARSKKPPVDFEIPVAVSAIGSTRQKNLLSWIPPFGARHPAPAVHNALSPTFQK